MKTSAVTASIHAPLLAIGAAIGMSFTAQAAPVCHDTSDYRVIARERDGGPGTDIIVRQAAPPKAPCVFAVKPKDYLPGTGESADVVAIQSRFLALDAGTGPDRRLLIFDVAARKKLIDVPYRDSDGVKPGPAGYTYWQIGTKPIKPAACPADWRKAPDNQDARSAHATSEMLFGFTDAIARPTGKTSCTQTQNDM